MSNFEKYEYWLEICDYDLETARAMQNTGRYLYVGFMCHQVIEKAFKAAMAKQTNAIPPKIHDLPKLGKLSGVWDLLSDEQERTVDKLIPLQIEARYPEYKENIAQTLTKEYCSELVKETEELLCWIKQLLEK